MRHLRRRADLVHALEHLTHRDKALARAYDLVGAPPLRRAQGGFAALVSLLISQQVSRAAARSIEARLTEACDHTLTPEAYLSLDTIELRRIGLSGQKQRYITILADAVACGALRPHVLARLSDADVHAQLTALTGIGTWTAANYLMFSLSRADIFPAGDLALQEGYRHLMGHKTRLDARALGVRAVRWKPYRSAAALLIWKYYRHSKDMARL